jgi:hypothetical protein
MLMTDTGATPDYRLGWVLVVAGLFAMGFGAHLLGADIDWRGRA